MTTSSHERTDVYTAITEQIITAIEAGADNPQMPWHSQGGLIERPINVSSGKAYRGVNNGLPDPFADAPVLAVSPWQARVTLPL